MLQLCVAERESERERETEIPRKRDINRQRDRDRERCVSVVLVVEEQGGAARVRACCWCGRVSCPQSTRKRQEGVKVTEYFLFLLLKLFLPYDS